VFAMYKKIEKPGAHEMWPIIRFLNARNMKPADIHRQLCEVYEERAMIDSMVWRWVRRFNEGRENVHDDTRSGRLSVVNEDLVHTVEEKIQENRQFTISSLSLLFHKFHSHFFAKFCLINFMVCIAGGIILRCRIQKLVSCYDKCLENGVHYVEK
jgi:hypothetical protein